MEYEDEFDPITFNLLKQTFIALEEQGMLDVVGITEDGEDIYQITEKGLAYYMTQQMDFETWARIGYEAGWCSPPVCYTHDCLPTTAGEDEDMNEGHDPCIHIVRLYDSLEQKNGCEANHSAVVWRATNRDW
jgi:hypothetical protein